MKEKVLNADIRKIELKMLEALTRRLKRGEKSKLNTFSHRDILTEAECEKYAGFLKSKGQILSAAYFLRK
ncbi:MAG: hypothetical protein ACR2MD_01825 [Aridibacter sp.]